MSGVQRYDDTPQNVAPLFHLSKLKILITHKLLVSILICMKQDILKSILLQNMKLKIYVAFKKVKI